MALLGLFKQEHEAPFRALMVAAVLIVVATGCLNRPAEPTDGDRLAVHPELPRYWQMGGNAVVLIGGSREDNLFQIADVEAHLDTLAAAGGNYVRNTMSSRDSGNVWPFARLPDGRYDLERPSAAYYDRFSHLLEAAFQRNIVVQLELWDRFDYARGPWLENPFRPANNINFTAEESGLANTYPEHPGSNNNPFFRSVPAQDDNTLLLRYQQAHIDRILERSLPYPNVLYTMDNETSANPDWGAHWARYVQEAAEVEGVTAHTTEMWDDWDLRGEQHRHTLDHPELYAFVDVSQNNHNTDQEHWDRLQWVRSYTEDVPRPLNNVKTYGADGGPYGSSRDGIERFWRSLFGGAASARFHRPPSGIGLNPDARTHLASARLFLDAYDLPRAEPDSESTLLSDRDPDEAYVSLVAGDRYAVYFPDGGTVELDLSGASGSFTLRWLDVESQAWQPSQAVEAGAGVTLSTPGRGHWIAVLKRP